MKKASCTLFLVFVFTHLFAKDLYPFEQNGKKGYKDAAGRIVIPAKYQEANNFLKNGLARVGILVTEGWKYGYLDTLGREVISMEYDRLDDEFYDDRVLACKDGKCGFLNVSGQAAVPLQYVAVKHFSEGLAAVYLNKKWGFIDPEGAVKIGIGYDDARIFSSGRAPVKLNGKWGFIDNTGKVIIPVRYDDIAFGGFVNALSGVKQDGKWAVINLNGEVLTQFTYDGIRQSFGTDLISVYREYQTDGGGPAKDKKTSYRYGLVKIVNGKGIELVPLEYDYMTILSNDLMWVKVGENEGIINTGNKVALPIKYKTGQILVSITRMPQGSIRENGLRKVFSLEGSGVKLWKYEHVNDEHEGMRSVLYKNKWGFINRNGQEAVGTKYDSVGIFSEGYAQVVLGGKTGFVDTLGNERINIKYDYADPFHGGVAWVKLNGKIGAIDKGGREIVLVKYDQILDFNNNLAPVSVNGKWGFIDGTGKEVIPAIYEQIGYFSEGLAPVQLNKKIGFINPQGKMIIKPQFDGFAEHFDDGRAKVIKNGKAIYIDTTGKEIK